MLALAELQREDLHLKRLVDYLTEDVKPSLSGEEMKLFWAQVAESFVDPDNNLLYYQRRPHRAPRFRHPPRHLGAQDHAQFDHV